MIAAIGRNGAQAPWLIEGAMDGAAFTVWVQSILAPGLEAGDIVVMDNLSVHKYDAARAAILATGAQIWDVPPYSPDLNPIEKMRSKIKADLRKAKAGDPEALCNAVGQALAKVSLQDITNWFAPFGYSLN